MPYDDLFDDTSMTTDNTLKSLRNAIAKCNPTQLDLGFACLKYREMGILRKAQGFAHIFGVKVTEIINDLPKTEDGRILDKPSRHLIHDILLEKAKEELSK